MLYILLIVACSDYNLTGRKSTSGSNDGPSAADSGGGTDTGAATAEACNGLDDDGDGAVDEGFGDVDADGVADCIDTACAVDVVPAGTVELTETCIGTVDDPWATRATRVWTGLSSNPNIEAVAQTPLVLQLTDDDGDGDVDADDAVDVAFIAWDGPYGGASSQIVVVEAGTWTERLTIPGVYLAGEMAVGDLDGDATPEIVAYDTTNTLRAWSADGAERWAVGPLTPYIGGMPSAAIVDLDGDGDAEVLAQEYVLDGATGAIRSILPVSGGFNITQHVAADLDLDGTAEVIYDGGVYAHDGTLRWRGLSAGGGGIVHAMVLNVDGDPAGEVVMAAFGTLALYDSDGTLLRSAPVAGGVASTPCAGDFNGDGQPEIAVPAQTALRVFDKAGTELAALPIVDTSTGAGCVGADLDGDGALEIIYADEETFFIIDGATGSTRVTYSEHASGTLIETPAVVDLDSDGSAEILLSTNDNGRRDAWMGLTLIEHAGDGWAAGPADWPANARVDGRFDARGVVVDVGTWWGRSNAFRAATGAVTARADARVSLDDVCLASCAPDGLVEVSVRVSNPGSIALGADTELVLYRVDADARTELARRSLGAELASGEAAASFVFTITTGDLGADGLVATVGEGTEDCDPADNTSAWLDTSPCP